ncbi:hypothetical protein LX16_4965 [Stackebrandtia albiflava]|uniref:Uncharacterized protein n=1 Tax=Stackebrandtia albiflava TaxID=406432 RepID=A0A562UQA8_9ACTN|nr:hypothetical protein [Stackebrandtia albiflava]TWJ07801.1 hypothetical protein LX16_4965 [Stackebrandtia albiflava]
MNPEPDEFSRRSVTRVVPPVNPRKLAKVPFVELADGRLQGVVSSGSDIARVYVSSIVADSHEFSCSTNNNRPCGGLGSRPCKHLQSMVAEAVVQYGYARVVRFLRVEAPADGTATDIVHGLKGGPRRAQVAEVFTRFLRHLAYLEQPGTNEPLPDMQWFPAMGAR